MRFFIGDILLKIDTRSTAETHYTKHHVMLVVGESERGYPIVMHMRGEPYWGLIQEELTKAKELILVQHQLPQETKAFLSMAAKQALSSKKFRLTEQIIREQLLAVSPFRTECSLESLTKLDALKAHYTKHTSGTGFNPQPEEELIMSCHQWVISIIHYACIKTNAEIPEALKLPPPLAWADRIAYSAQISASATCTCITLWPPGHQIDKITTIPEPKPRAEQINPASWFSFFSKEVSVSPTTSKEPQCVVM